MEYPDDFQEFLNSDTVSLYKAVPLDEVLLDELLYLAFVAGKGDQKDD